MHDFDDKLLLAAVKKLSRPCRVIFAAACAQRLLPSYERFRGKVPAHPSVKPPTAPEALSRLWGDLAGNNLSLEELQGLIAALTKVIPSEDEAYEAGEPYAEDAVSAVVYALRERANGSGQDAVWAAQRVYNALDHFVINADGTKDNSIDERAVLSSRLVQKELSRQRRDIDKLRAECSDDASAMTLASEFRRTSEAESRDVFQ